MSEDKLVANPALAYTGRDPYSFLHKGGASNLGVPAKIPLNTNGANPAYASTGPKMIIPNTPFINSGRPQRGGSGCSSCSGIPVMKGGGCGCGIPFMKGGACPLCLMGFMVGGKRHKKDCKCKYCKKMRKMMQTGGNPGVPYPNGLTGSPWNGGNLATLPGVDGVQGNRNYFPHNDYKVDPQTAMQNVGANRPFLHGGKRTRKNLKGGAFTNLLAQDLVNLGRQVQYGFGSSYNLLRGYAPSESPLPWKGQLNPLNK
jgi:hypothetical protein